MTLYDLTNTITIQGNVAIKIFDEHGDETETRFFRDQDDFNCYNACDDIEDLTLSYIYSTKRYDGTPWLVIELSK